MSIRLSRFAHALLFGTLAIFATSRFSPPTAVAREIFVDNVAGDDRNEGQTPIAGSGLSGPCRSITRALFIARAGDSIVVAKTAEPYRESITLEGNRHSGISTKPFRLIGNGATLDGRQPVRTGAWQPVGEGLYRFPAARQSLGMLYRDERPAYPRARPVADSTPRQLKPGEGLLYDGHYYARLDADRTPVQYDFSATALPVGITLYQVRGVIIENLIVQGFQQDGICAADDAADIELTGVTARGNGRSGVAICGSSRVSLEASLLANNGHAQLWLEGYSHAQVTLCTVPTGSAPALWRAGGRLTWDGEPK